MFKKNFVIFSPGRTGGSLISNNLLDYFKANVNYIHNMQSFDMSDCTCILSKRKNVIESVFSQLIVNKSNETVDYSDKKIDLFDVEIDQFRSLYNYYNNYYNNIDLRPYSSIITIWFEDLIADPYYLFSNFNIVEKTNYYERLNSPYDYKKIIRNYLDLEIIANRENFK